MSKRLNTYELAEHLGLHYQTVYSMIKNDEIPYIKARKQYRFDADAVERHLSNHNVIAQKYQGAS